MPVLWLDVRPNQKREEETSEQIREKGRMKEWMLIGAGMSLVLWNAGIVTNNVMMTLVGELTAAGWFILCWFERDAKPVRKLKKVQSW